MRLGGRLLRIGRTGEERTEELQLLPRLDLLPLRRPRLELGQQFIDRIRGRGELLEPRLPGPERRIAILHPAVRLLEFEEAPDPELVPVLVGLRLLKLYERRLELLAVV